MKKQLFLILILVFVGWNINGQTQLISNGTFQSGSTGWTTSGNWHITNALTCYNNELGYAYAGDASGNAVINETGDLKQTIIIPANATSATFSFYVSKTTDETSISTVYDYVNVYLLNSSGTQLMQFSPTNINNLYAGTPVTKCDGYSSKSFTIPTTYFGQTLQIDFNVHTDGGPKNTMFRIDDVSLLVTVPSCNYSISPTSNTSVPYAGGSGYTIGVTAGSGCSWTASIGSYSWITITSGSSGSGNGTCYYSVTNNPNSTSRTGYITIAGQSFTVTQAGLSCSYSISPSSISPSSSSGSGSISVSATSGCSWSAVSNASWLTVTSGSSGNGNGTVNYSYASNGTTSSRSGSITIGGNTFTVTQAGTNTNQLYGVDISHNNGTISWSTVFAANNSFSFAKCSEGLTDADDGTFSTNMMSGKNAGVVMGAYHIGRPDNRFNIQGAVDEANHFLSLAKSYIGANYLPPAVDLEPVNIESLNDWSTLSTWIQNWMTTIKNATGIWPVLYLTRCDAGSLYPYYQSGVINQNIKLWIADYNHAAGSPGNYASCSNWVGWPWLFHQYFAPCDACASNDPAIGMDLDIFNGDMTAFNNLIGVSSGTPPPNDNCANAILLPDNKNCTYTQGTVDYATDDGFPSLPSCNGTSSTQFGVFYKFVAATTSATITVDPNNTSITGLDAVVVVYSGSNIYNLQELNNNSCADPTGKVQVTLPVSGLIPGQTYWIRVYDFGATQPAIGNGSFNICVSHSTSALNELSASDKIKIYPNPTTGKFEVSEIEALGDKCKIEIFNHLGMSIYVSENETEGNKISLDLSAYPVGIYIVKLSNNGLSYQKKLIKK